MFTIAIPADLIADPFAIPTELLHNELWYDTPGGIRGLLMPDADDSAGGWGYVVCEPATQSYQAMTRYNWQPIRGQARSWLR
jgi:hypothetical protein